MKRPIATAILMLTLMASLLISAVPAVQAGGDVVIKAPGYGELLLTGTQYPIQWQVHDVSISRVEFTYSPDDGDHWYPIFSMDNPNWDLRDYLWTVPDTTGSNCSIRVHYLYPGGEGYIDSPLFSLSTGSGDWVNPPLTMQDVRPAMPTGVIAQSVDQSSIEISWKDNASDETAFILERQEKGVGTMVYLASLAPNSVSYTDSGLESGKTYVYRLKSTNNYGDSYYSNKAEATYTPPPAILPPEPPTELKAVAKSSSSIELNWKDNASDEKSYVIEHRRKDIGSWGAFITLPADSTSYTESGMTAGQTFEYRVKATKEGASSEYSNIAEAATMPGPSLSAVTLKFFPGSAVYYVNKQYRTMDAEPVVSEGRILLPIHYVVEPLGAVSIWNETEGKATITMGDTSIELWTDRSTALVNGIEIMIDPDNPAVVPLALPPGRIMLPLRFVSENLGCGVSWDSVGRSALILYQPAGI